MERFPNKPIESESIEPAAEIESDVEKFGTKFAVQKLFYKLGMCGIDTRLFEPETSIDEIEKNLGEMEATDRGFTIRFSYKNALNLPRGFFKTPQECLDFIKKEFPEYEWEQIGNQPSFHGSRDLTGSYVLAFTHGSHLEAIENAILGIIQPSSTE